MATYTTQSGSVLTAENGKLTVVTTKGQTRTETLGKTHSNRLGSLQFDSATAAWVDAQYEQYVADRKAALEAAVPGIHQAMELEALAYNERTRYRRSFERMMDDEDNDGARPPRPEDRSYAEQLSALLAANPRAALYLLAKQQAENAHWADNTGKGAAGRKAMEILAAGGSSADAETALAVRREYVD